MGDTSEVQRRLREAIGTGEVVGICYHGGSQPGAYREVIPLQINGDQVRMRCRTSGAAKTFSISKIELRTEPTDTGDGLSTWNAATPPPAPYSTVVEIEAAHRAALEALGWHVAVTRTEDGEFLKLHRKTKAGKPLKHPVHVLGYEPTTWDASYNPERQPIRTNVRPRVRPWSAGGKTWGDPAKAVETFLQMATAGP